MKLLCVSVRLRNVSHYAIDTNPVLGDISPCRLVNSSQTGFYYKYTTNVDSTLIIFDDTVTDVL